MTPQCFRGRPSGLEPPSGPRGTLRAFTVLPFSQGLRHRTRLVPKMPCTLSPLVCSSSVHPGATAASPTPPSQLLPCCPCCGFDLFPPPDNGSIRPKGLVRVLVPLTVPRAGPSVQTRSLGTVRLDKPLVPPLWKEHYRPHFTGLFLG